MFVPFIGCKSLTTDQNRGSASVVTGHQCIIAPEEQQKLLALDYKGFDQNLHGGWRKYDQLNCYASAASLIDGYIAQNSSKLLEYQRTGMTWHAGQMYAFAGQSELAVARFKKSYNRNVAPDDTFKWNAYVKGTIAFLEQDMKSLIQARDEMAAVSADQRSKNFAILESFVRCFDKTYSEAYDSSCK
jgi:hypothetical protein